MACAGPAQIRNTRAGYHAYTDDSVTVHSPRVDGAVQFEDVTVSPYWTSDVISAATPVATTVDVVSQATSYREVRNEGGLGLRLTESERSVGGAYRLSNERDYTSHTVSMSIAHDLLDRQATARFGSRLAIDTVGRADVSEFSRSLTNAAIDLGWSHIVNPELVLHFAYTLEYRRGFQSNPYRYVPIYEQTEGPAQFLLAEEGPTERTRHAAEGLAVWAITPQVFVHGAYRYYVDGWGVQSHTARTQLWYEIPGDRVRLQGNVRLYTQSAASFFEPRYESADGFRTGDYRLSQMDSLVAGLRGEFTFREAVGGAGLRSLLSYHYRLARFSDFPTRDSLNAHVFGVSLIVEVP